MKKISKILRYMGDYKGRIALYFLCSLLAVVFSLLSLGMLSPILQVIFNQQSSAVPATGGNWSITDMANSAIQGTITQNGPATALAIVCVLAVTFTLLKNLFLYFSLYVLTPLRNSII